MHIYDGVFGFDDVSEMRVSLKLTPTTFLVTVNVLVYIYTSLIGGNFITTNNSVLVQLGQYNISVLNGEYWKLL